MAVLVAEGSGERRGPRGMRGRVGEGLVSGLRGGEVSVVVVAWFVAIGAILEESWVVWKGFLRW